VCDKVVCWHVLEVTIYLSDIKITDACSSPKYDRSSVCRTGYTTALQYRGGSRETEYKVSVQLRC
jgi:hypothetical protein